MRQRGLIPEAERRMVSNTYIFPRMHAMFHLIYMSRRGAMVVPVILYPKKSQEKSNLNQGSK